MFMSMDMERDTTMDRNMDTDIDMGMEIDTQYSIFNGQNTGILDLSVLFGQSDNGMKKLTMPGTRPLCPVQERGSSAVRHFLVWY